jgi:RimJ/RimL family protein N-acetyltransferase
MSRKVPAGNKPMLETERLALRSLSEDDVDSLHRISNEPNVRLHLWDNEQVSQATVKDLIAQSDRMLSEEKIGVFGVRIRGRGALV